jgi:hypothetical protein
MSRLVRISLLVAALCLVAGWCAAQRGGLPGQHGYRRGDPRNGVPDWEVHEELPNDLFTFARIRYTSAGRWRRDGVPVRWSIDYPDAELNLSYRLKEMTSMQVHPDGVVIDLDSPELYDHPFIYMIEAGDLLLSDSEARNLRRYLLNGGFLMFDDFWGEADYRVVANELKKVLPEFEPREIPISHPIFKQVFQLKEKPQIPNVRTGTLSQYTGVTWETEDSKVPHYRGIFDEQGRLMVCICHNTDLGDGWEQEGANHYFFKEFSEKKAYPLGINILTYTMSH